MNTSSQTRNDALTILVFGVIASAAVVFLAVGKMLHLFVPGGIAWSVPVHAVEASASGFTTEYRGSWVGEEVTGSVSSLDVVVPNVNTLSQVCFALAIVVAAVTLLTVIACTLRLAWNLLRDRLISHSSRRIARVLLWTAVTGAVITLASWHLGKNGVEGALGVQATHTNGPVWWAWYAIILFCVVSIGLIDAGFRRAMRLQDDTEGLV